MNLLDAYLIMVLPLIISNVIHMIIVKKNAFAILNVPINNNLFGPNKSLRGFVLLPLLNALVLYLLVLSIGIDLEVAFKIGYFFGIVYLLGELPNSFIKRRVGIKAGEKPKEKKIIFTMMDKMDSSLATTILFYFLFSVDILFAIKIFVISFLTHICISFVLLKTGIKRSL